MITAYFDATYNHPKSDSPEPVVHTLAAYIATNDNWRKFRKEWRLELAKKNLDHFHMKDFEFARSQLVGGREIPRKSLYNSWKLEEFVPFLQKLHQVINRKGKDSNYRLEALATSIIKSDFDETIPEILKGYVQCSSYYVTNAVNLVKAAAWRANTHNLAGPILYVFSHGDKEGSNLERLFEDMWNDQSARSYFRLSKDNPDKKPYKLLKMKDEPGLQAADVAAYELHKGVMEWIERNYVDIPLEEMRASLRSLARTDHFGWVYRKKELRENFEEIISLNRHKIEPVGLSAPHADQ